MEGIRLKEFIISEAVIGGLFILLIWGTFDMMQDAVWWQYVVVILLLMFGYMVVGALNAAYHLKMKQKEQQ